MPDAALSRPVCPRCGQKLSPSGTLGLCPRCLLMNLEDDEGLDGEALEDRLFGDYELIEEVAVGGMGTVFKARHRELGRVVALKVITAGALASRAMVERFRIEAQVAASLSHPGIVPIYEIGEAEGQQFFSMELIDGPRLDHFHERKPLPPRVAVDIIIRVAEAVHFAHQRGILHRDIKPGNILLDRHGSPHLTDFGLAKVLERESTLTHTVAMLGTPSYISPEQARGNNKELTTATDVYGLGAVLYELLTGLPPFAGGTTFETIRLVLEQEPRPPSTLNPIVDKDLETICLKCLEKEPGRRYSTAEALAQDLQHWRRGEPIIARPVGVVERGVKWARRRPGRAILVGALALAAMVMVQGSFIFSYHLNATARESNQRLVRLYLNQSVQEMDEGDYFAAIPWTLEAVKVDKSDLQEEDIARRRIHSVLAHSPGLKQAWFHEEKALASYFCANETRVVVQFESNYAKVFDVQTGALLKRLQHPSPITALTVQDKWIATADANGNIRVWDAFTLAPLSASMKHQTLVNSLAFSPDGKLLVSGSDDFSASIWDVGTGRLLYKLPHASRVSSVAFSPTQKLVVTGSSGGSAILWEVESGRRILEMEHLRGDNVRHVEFSGDGMRIMTLSGRGARIWDAKTGEAITPMVSHPNVYTYTGCFSPDGEVFVTCGRDSMARVWNTQTGIQSAPSLRHDNGVQFVTFDQSSSRIATASFDRTIRIWDWKRGEPLCPPLRHSTAGIHAAFNKDGTFLLSTDGDSTRLWDFSKSEPVSATRVNSVVRKCGFSADGSCFVYQTENGELEAWDLRTMQAKLDTNILAGGGLPLADYGFPPAPIRSKDGKFEVDFSLTSARLRESRSGRVLSLLPHREYVRTAAFSDDGELVATGSGDKSARVWDTRTGLPVTPPLPHFSTAMYVAFSPDKKWLVTMVNARTIYFWSIQRDERSFDDLEQLSEVLNSSRINSAGMLANLENSSELEAAWKKVDVRPAASQKISATHALEVQAQNYFMRDKLKEAVQAYGQALESEPNKSHFWFKRAEIYSELGEWTNALGDIEEALRLNQHVAAYWERRGEIFKEIGNSDLAEADLQRAVAMNPEFISAWRRIGQIRLTRHDWEGAFGAFKKAQSSWRRVVGLDLFASSTNAYQANQIDLRPFFNATLDHIERPGDREGEDLSRLPRGNSEFGGTQFQVEGAIRLLGRVPRINWATLPERVEGIPIRKRCQKLHFLHSTMGEVGEGVLIGKYTVQYADGDRVEIPIIYGEQMRDSFFPAVKPLNDAHSALAFSLTPAQPKANHAIYQTTWANPKPDTEIVMLDLESAVASSAPVLLGVTLE